MGLGWVACPQEFGPVAGLLRVSMEPQRILSIKESRNLPQLMKPETPQSLRRIPLQFKVYSKTCKALSLRPIQALTRQNPEPCAPPSRAWAAGSLATPASSISSTPCSDTSGLPSWICAVFVLRACGGAGARGVRGCGGAGVRGRRWASRLAVHEPWLLPIRRGSEGAEAKT